MSTTKKNSTWDWLERISLFIGMLLGVVAFYWQLQERAADRKERLVSVYTRVESVNDSLYIINLDLLNAAKRTAHIRSVAVGQTMPRSRTTFRELQIDTNGELREIPPGQLLRFFEDSTGAIQLEPNASMRFKSRPVNTREMRVIADSGYVLVSTLRNEMVIRVDPAPLNNALLNAAVTEVIKVMGTDDSRLGRLRLIIETQGHP